MVTLKAERSLSILDQTRKVGPELAAVGEMVEIQLKGEVVEARECLGVSRL